MTALTRDPVCLPITDASGVGEARRAAVSIADGLDFNEQRRGEVAIVVTELASNLLRHATGGEIIVRSMGGATPPGLEVMAVDRGPGIANMADALRDGYSTGSGGTPGTGLGAVRRLSASFEAFTGAKAGTVIVARLFADHPPAAAPAAAAAQDALDFGVVCLPKKGEEACGDAWYAQQTGHGRTMVLVADGLGHGLQASEASRQAVRLFRENLHLDTARAVETIHAGLRATRGAAVAVAELSSGRREIRFTGVGNIAAAVVVEGKPRSMVSHNGTAGAEARRIQEFVYPWPQDSLIVMHSDGLGSQWQLGQYPGLRFRPPALIAGVLYRDFRRERDDVTVLVIAAGGAGRP